MTKRQGNKKGSCMNNNLKPNKIQLLYLNYIRNRPKAKQGTFARNDYEKPILKQNRNFSNK
jgi:hypothetical protein